MEEARRRTLHGRRRGKKLRAGQQSLLDTLLPRLAVALPAEPLVTPCGGVAASPVEIDLARLFGGTMPEGGVWLEVGFGGGEHLVWQAERHPDVGFIGCEPYVNGVAKCLAHIARTGVSNVRLFADDARFVMAALPPRSLARVFVLFPDPWPKTRHHKRRFVQRHNLDVLARLMRPHAELRLATDDPGYLSWMVEHACTHRAFEWLAERPADWRARPDDWPPTRYEQKMLAGRKPVFLRLRRRPEDR
jgi:tRNA (guanine-N7-)-methyltransferase